MRSLSILVGYIACLVTGERASADADLDLWVEQERCAAFYWEDCNIDGCTEGQDSQCAQGFEHFVYAHGLVGQDSEILEREIRATGHASGGWFNFPGNDGSRWSYSRLRVVFELPVQAVVDLSAQIESEWDSGGEFDWEDWTYSYTLTLSLRDFCPDVDGNGAIGFADLLAVLRAWGETCEPECPEDVDGNSVVDLADLLLILTSWGPCATESTRAGSGPSEGPVSVRLSTLEGTPLFDLSIRCRADHSVELDDSIQLAAGRYVLEADADARGAGVACGACCFDDGTCTENLVESECVVTGGSYQGDDTTCAATCLGACCFADGTCMEVTEDLCAELQGAYRGDGTTCDTEECVPFGACGWLVDAPIDWEDDLCGEPDSCPLRVGPDIQWEVTIPADGAWRFATCGSYATVITADTSTCCGDEYQYEGNCGFVRLEDLVAGQVVYVTLEAVDDCGPVRVLIDGPW